MTNRDSGDFWARARDMVPDVSLICLERNIVLQHAVALFQLL
jgi:hypothetical protein